MKYSFEGKLDFTTEDSGAALIGELEGDDELFIRIQSWDPRRRHPRAMELKGRTVRVTIEVIE